MAQAREILAVLEQGIADGKTNLRPLGPAVRAEIAIAAAESEADKSGPADDPLFRLRIRHWAMEEGDLAALVPVRDPQLRVVAFDYDVSEFMGVENRRRNSRVSDAVSELCRCLRQLR